MTYAVYYAGVKRYDQLTALVQSSKTPISLGQEVRRYMNTQGLMNYVHEKKILILKDSPSEIYIYNWIGKAQGKMIFDVGVAIVKTGRRQDLLESLEVKTYPSMKFASLFYVGPFPHQKGSGWEHIRWEDRAKEKGRVYDERVYRELYHTYDYENFQHITEIQIRVE